MANAKRRVIPVNHDYVLPRARSIVKMFEIDHTRTGDIQPARNTTETKGDVSY